jgi:NAD(P)-dependent dehydrogenase (short-subunit alcohol dehydrogenase family)
MNILVTGGSSGLGASITKKLASNADNFVYFTYPFDIQDKDTIEKEFHNTKGIKCNFRDEKEIDALIAKFDEFNLDILVNNAWATKIIKKHYQKIDYQDFIDGFMFNVVPLIKITQELISRFRKKRFGKIVTILTSSIVNKPPAGYSEYVAAKSYIASLSKSWANENAAFNITSNCISPSFMQTAFTDDTDERVVEEMVNSHPLKRVLTTEEVADSVFFLINSTQQINGINLLMNAASDIA